MRRRRTGDPEDDELSGLTGAMPISTTSWPAR